MNKLIIKVAVVIFAISIVFPTTATSQEKKVKLKTIKVVDGEEVITDTTYTIIGDEDEADFVKTFSWVQDGDSNKVITIDIDADIDTDGKGNVFFYSKDGNEFFSSGDFKKHGHKTWTDDDKHVLYIDGKEFDMEHMEEFKFQMEKLDEEMAKMKIELGNEKLILLKELEGLEDISELERIELLEELEELKNIEIEIPEIHVAPYHSGVHFVPEHNEYFEYHFLDHNNASEKELRDAGIKVKANRLQIDDIDIDVEDGVVDLEFVIKGEGSPKVTVFNFYGEKVFSGKPELLNGEYSIKIDLSSKQHGTYFLQITLKDSSTTKKLKL